MFVSRILLRSMLGALILLSGCSSTEPEDSGDDPKDTTKGHPPTEMVGSWAFRSVTIDGATADLGKVQEWRSGAVGANISVQENGAFVYEEVDQRGGQLWAEWGFIYVDGTEIDINFQFDQDGPREEMIRVLFTLQGDVMTLVENDEGEQVQFVLHRR